MLMLKKIYVVAHTHWDFEWYFSRQEARVQFIFHMDDVFQALANNELDYYMLDGQMSIIDDYLASCPEKKSEIKKYVKSGRLYIGPWYTQIDEMVTSGESIVRNLKLGMKLSEKLGGTTKIGYLPDSFGQSQDMPKIYNGFGINHAVFWRGLPRDIDARYFYWSSNDGSEVLTANIRDGYYAGVDLIENDNFSELMQKVSTHTNAKDLVIPVGGDQRAIDLNLKDRINLANQFLGNEYKVIESNYPNYFKALEKTKNLPTVSGEFIDPSVSKIHRGIYSSRYDLKQIYDTLERRMTYQIEPLTAIAGQAGIEYKSGLIDEIWKIIARGQAHDSSGGCNSDKTNSDIYHRAMVADQLSQSLKDYLLRKLSISIDSLDDLFVWNPLPMDIDEVREFEISTKSSNFKIETNDKLIDFDLIEQEEQNAAVIRRNPEEMDDEIYYISKIAIQTRIPSTDWISFKIIEDDTSLRKSIKDANLIENEFYRITFANGKITLYDKENKRDYVDFINFEDGGDEGDTYDYSPAFDDWILNLGFAHADVEFKAGNNIQIMKVNGEWNLPVDLKERKNRNRRGVLKYTIILKLRCNSKTIKFDMKIDNQISDHRLRLVLNPDLKTVYSYSDTPFGVIERPVEDTKINKWREIGYREEPTAMRPMIHFANIHDNDTSCTFITNGMKDFQVIGKDFNRLAITLFRGVGFLGRADMKRRPGDASGLVMKSVATPDSQLQKNLSFSGAIILDSEMNAQSIQTQHLLLSQDKLFYQKQDFNRFTTPLQYFTMNKLPANVKHTPILKIEDLQLVISSWHVSEDQTGYVLRLYNPTNQKILKPGTLKLFKSSSLILENLNGEIIETTANDTDRYEMKPFVPGEIRTYGIYPRN